MSPTPSATGTASCLARQYHRTGGGVAVSGHSQLIPRKAKRVTEFRAGVWIFFNKRYFVGPPAWEMVIISSCSYQMFFLWIYDDPSTRNALFNARSICVDQKQNSPRKSQADSKRKVLGFPPKLLHSTQSIQVRIIWVRKLKINDNPNQKQKTRV